VTTLLAAGWTASPLVRVRCLGSCFASAAFASFHFPQFLAGNVAFYTWLSLGCPCAIGWPEELVAVVGRPTTAVLRGKGRFAFVGMFPQVSHIDTIYLTGLVLTVK
jgi:hypothetical protein